MKERRQGRNIWAGSVSVCCSTAVPEASPEVVAAGHEAGIGWRVDDAAHDVVVSQRQQVFPLGSARVPAAQADGTLIWQQHVVLCVVEHALCTMHLTAAQPRTYDTQEEHYTKKANCTTKTTSNRSECQNFHSSLIDRLSSFPVSQKCSFLQFSTPYTMIMVTD